MSVVSVSTVFSSRSTALGLNARIATFMDHLIAIGLGLSVRYLVDLVSHHDFKVVGTIVGLWEGVVMLHFINQGPKSFDPYLAYAVRLLLDFFFTASLSRFVLTIVWSCLGMVLADVAKPISNILGVKKYWERFLRDMEYMSTLLPPLPTISLGRSRIVRFTASRAPSHVSDVQSMSMASHPSTISPTTPFTAHPTRVSRSSSAATGNSAPVDPTQQKRRVPGFFPGYESSISTLSILNMNDVSRRRHHPPPPSSIASSVPGASSFPLRFNHHSGSTTSHVSYDLDAGNVSTSTSVRNDEDGEESADNALDIPDEEQEVEIRASQQPTPRVDSIALPTPTTVRDPRFDVRLTGDPFPDGFEDEEEEPPLAEIRTIPDRKSVAMDWGADTARDDAETALEYRSALSTAPPPAYPSSLNLEAPPPIPMKDRQSSGRSGRSGKSGRSDGSGQLPTPLSTGAPSFSSKAPHASKIPLPVPAVEKKPSTSSQKADKAAAPSQSQTSKPPSRRQSTSQPQPPPAQSQRIIQQDSTSSTPSPIAAPVPPPLNQRVQPSSASTAPPQRPPSSQSQSQPQSQSQSKHQRRPSQASQISQPPSYSQIQAQPLQPQADVPILAQPAPKRSSLLGSLFKGNPGQAADGGAGATGSSTNAPPISASAIATTAAPSPITPVDRPQSAASVPPLPVPFKGSSANTPEPQASSAIPRNSSASMATIKPGMVGVGQTGTIRESSSGNGTPVKSGKANLEKGNNGSAAATPTKAESLASIATQEAQGAKKLDASKAKTERAPSVGSTAAPVSLAATAPPIRASAKPSAIPSIAQIFSLGPSQPPPASQPQTTDGSSSEDVFSDVPSTGADSLTTEPEQSRISRVLELRSRSRELDQQVVEFHKQMEKAKTQPGSEGKELVKAKGREIEKASKKKLKIETKIRKIFDGFDPLDDPPERVELAKEGVGPAATAAVEKALEQHLYPGTESQELQVVLAVGRMGQKQKAKVLELLKKYSLEHKDTANPRIMTIIIPPA